MEMTIASILLTKNTAASRDEEMSHIHHLFIAPRPAAQPLCRHSKRCFASLGEASSTFQVFVRFEPSCCRFVWWSLLVGVGCLSPEARNPKIADHQPEKPRACHSIVCMSLSSAQETQH